jgi:hypothetical protein
MQRWNWFLAADYKGEWIITHGYAEVSESSGTIEALLRYDTDIEPYHRITARLGEDNIVRASVESPGRDTETFELEGSLFEGQEKDGMVSRTILLTDGTTIIALAYHPKLAAGR